MLNWENRKEQFEIIITYIENIDIHSAAWKILEEVLIISCRALLLIVPLLMAVAFSTLVERKVLGTLQRRRGPNVVGMWGLLQPFADGLKLIIKETVLPVPSNKILFIVAPILTLLFSTLGWGALPIDENAVYFDINLGLLYIFAISSLGVYGIIISGWSSNSKYAFLGALRSAAQMISYEIAIGLMGLCIVILAGSLNLTDIVLAQENLWFGVPLFPLFFLFFIASLAETNRPPFDLPEAEAELVSGYNVEYSGVGFALFFIGEYANILLMCSLQVVLFLGGWLPPFFLNFEILKWIPGVIWFSLKLWILLCSFIWVRASFPRLRYDQLMRLGWKVFLPLSLAFLVITVVFVVYFI